MVNDNSNCLWFGINASLSIPCQAFVNFEHRGVFQPGSNHHFKLYVWFVLSERSLKFHPPFPSSSSSHPAMVSSRSTPSSWASAWSTSRSTFRWDLTVQLKASIKILFQCLSCIFALTKTNLRSKFEHLYYVDYSNLPANTSVPSLGRSLADMGKNS